MPIYEYACVANGHKFEVFQKMSDPAPASCPTCGGGEVRKLVSTSAFVLKGGGWYRDHYGLKSGGASDGASGESGGKSASESAPAAAKPADSAAAPASTSAPSTGSGGSTGGSGSSGGSSGAAASS